MRSNTQSLQRWLQPILGCLPFGVPGHPGQVFQALVLIGLLGMSSCNQDGVVDLPTDPVDPVSDPTPGPDEPTSPDPKSPSDYDTLPPVESQKEIRKVSLRSVESCEQLIDARRRGLQTYVDQANAFYKRSLEECNVRGGVRGGGTTCSTGIYIYGPSVTMSLDSATSATSSGSSVMGGVRGDESGLQAGKDYSTTNTQEAGVDEADFVKTDGDYIYLVSGKQIVILSSRPPEATREIVRTDIEGTPTEFYLKGGRLAVFSSVYRNEPAKKAKKSSIAYDEGYYYGYGRMQTKVTLLDVSDRAKPRTLRETYFDGSYSTSRRIQSRAFLVLSITDPLWANANSFVKFDKTKSEPYSIDESKLALENLLPKITDRILTDGGPVERKDVVMDCRAFLSPSVSAGFGFTAVFSFPVDDILGEIGFSSVVGSPNIAYASTNALYVTQYDTYRYYAWDGTTDKIPEEKTLIHKFDLTADPLKPAYVSSGSVPGHIANPFSLGEHRGVLRVATTIGQTWGTGAQAARNNVLVLQSQGPDLVTVGEIRDFATTERIYSARFIGERGFVVTFRQVDPLFTVDLRDPAKPRLAGELKVPGFSTYLHPMDENHLLSIGQDATEQGRITGLQLSLFDVTDFNAPKLQHKQRLGERYGSSEALYEHKAFNYFAPKDLLAIPMVYYPTVSSSIGAIRGSASSTTTGFAGHEVYRVTLQDGFRLLGQVDHSDFLAKTSNSTNDYDYRFYSVGPRRSIVIGDEVYTLSNLGLKVNPISDVAQTLASVPLLSLTR